VWRNRTAKIDQFGMCRRNCKWISDRQESIPKEKRGGRMQSISKKAHWAKQRTLDIGLISIRTVA